MRTDVFADGSSFQETSRVQSGTKLPIENVSFQHRNIIPSTEMISLEPLFSASQSYITLLFPHPRERLATSWSIPLLLVTNHSKGDANRCHRFWAKTWVSASTWTVRQHKTLLCLSYSQYLQTKFFLSLDCVYTINNVLLLSCNRTYDYRNYIRHLRLFFHRGASVSNLTSRQISGGQNGVGPGSSLGFLLHIHLPSPPPIWIARSPWSCNTLPHPGC